MRRATIRDDAQDKQYGSLMSNGRQLYEGDAYQSTPSTGKIREAPRKHKLDFEKVEIHCA